MEDLNITLKRAIDHITKQGSETMTIVGSGGGIGISKLLTIPGASSAIHQIVFPYGKTSWFDYLNPCHWDKIENNSFVSFDFIKKVELHIKKQSNNYLIFSASLGTCRERKGDNKCVAIKNGQAFELSIPKEEFSEDFDKQLEIRQKQDETVTRWLLMLILS